MKQIKKIITFIVAMGVIAGLIYTLPAILAGLVTFSFDIYIGAVTNATYASLMDVVTIISLIGVMCYLEEQDNG